MKWKSPYHPHEIIAAQDEDKIVDGLGMSGNEGMILVQGESIPGYACLCHIGRFQSISKMTDRR